MLKFAPMNCEFQNLYFSKDGYVVLCRECGHYQVAFECICLTMVKSDLDAFRRIVAINLEKSADSYSEHSKCIYIQTPAEGISFILTKAETKKLHAMLEDADTEERALSMIQLFTQ